MYETTPTEYGYQMRFASFIEIDEMREWASAVRSQLAATDGAETTWHCLVDMRELDAMSPQSRELMTDVKSECHDCGLDRVATVVSEATVRLQFTQMSRGTGGESERFVPADQYDDALAAGEAWVRDGVEPDQWTPDGGSSEVRA